MDEENYQLLLKNCAIVHENEVLRKRSEELAQENKALLEELIEKLSTYKQPDPQHGASSAAVNQPPGNANDKDDEEKK
ncbi:uncharacterized protein J3R85_012821 [Psidium guajava]|nr:uncharacterized protein J3R85_012821 [Psidium guajava]